MQNLQMSVSRETLTLAGEAAANAILQQIEVELAEAEKGETREAGSDLEPSHRYKLRFTSANLPGAVRPTLQHWQQQIRSRHG